MGIFEKVFGTHSEKEIKRIQPLVDKVLALDESYKAYCSVVCSLPLLY